MLNEEPSFMLSHGNLFDIGLERMLFMPSNVKIPLSLLFQTIYLLECIDICYYDYSIRLDYDNVLCALNHKKDSLELREAYSNIIKAKDEDNRHHARMLYLQLKRDIQGEL